MAKTTGRSVFVCERCGNESPKWEGKCPSCGEWNTLFEHRADVRGDRGRSWSTSWNTPVQELSEVSVDEQPRLEVSSAEVNRVLGGGIVPGSVVLLAGEPGIGKSTLLLRLAADIASTAGQALYVAGEESAAQVRMRADRLGIDGKRMLLLQATALDEVMGQLEEVKPAFVLVDSIQTIHDDTLTSTAGSVGQIRECARVLMTWAKSQGVPMFLTGHVTKEGDIAGPRILEHMVDVVLYMEGDPISSWRLLRGVKNRFGSTNEVGVLEMGELGLTDVADPSQEFLSQRSEGAVGSVVVPTLEGTRPLLVEVQALTSPSVLPAPRRIATGIEFNRLLLVCAVLTRRAGLSLANQDVVVNVTGGLRISEPAADLGVAVAIASSLRNAPVEPQLAAIGEVGLTGEIRRVGQLPRRIAEAARLGLRTCLVPPGVDGRPGGPDEMVATPVSTIRSALRAAIKSGGRAAADEADDLWARSGE